MRHGHSDCEFHRLRLNYIKQLRMKEQTNSLLKLCFYTITGFFLIHFVYSLGIVFIPNLVCIMTNYSLYPIYYYYQ